MHSVDPVVRKAATLAACWRARDIEAVVLLLADTASREEAEDLILALLTMRDKPDQDIRLLAAADENASWQCERVLPELMSAAGLAAHYCGTASWEDFLAWAKGKGYMNEEAQVTKQTMITASRAMHAIIRQVQAEMMEIHLEQALAELKSVS